MRSAAILVCLGPLLLLCTAIGCGKSPGQPTPASSPAESTGASGDSLHVETNQTLSPDGGPVTRVDVIDLSDAERKRYAAYSPEERAGALRICVLQPGMSQLPAVLGEWTVEPTTIRFSPRFPLGPGLQYQVVISRKLLADRLPEGQDNVAFDFSTTARPVTAATAVTQVYPTSETLPANQLKFYIHFSGAMSRGDAYRHVHLLNAQGQELEAVFLELGEELWDPALTRFTLLCDPGRVKRGLVPREELGSVLEAGQDYTLVIDADWPDAHGKPLTKEFRKSFHTRAADHDPIDIQAWKLELPKANSRDPLVVHFPESLDHSLLERMLRVQQADDQGTTQDIAGKIGISDEETAWRFTPQQAWRAGDYKIRIETTLEDLAGNSIGRAFDVDTIEPIQKRIEVDTVEIPFTVH